MTLIRILFAALFVYLLCRAAGQLFFHALRLPLRKSERAFLEFTTGASLVSTCVFALAACHLIYTWSFAAFAALTLALWLRFARGRIQIRQPDYLSIPPAWMLLFWACFAIYGTLYFLTALMPELSADGVVYHLGLVSRYLEHHGFYPVYTTMYAGLSAGIEMLFLVAFAFGRHSAAAVVHLIFLTALTFGILSFGRRMNAPRAGVVGALLFFIAPVVGRDATVAYIDVAAAAVVFAAFFLLEIGSAEKALRWLIAAGLLAGFAYASKFTAGIAAVYGLIFTLVVSRGKRLQSAAVFSLFVCVTAAPWIVKDIVQFRNPFFPLFNDWFPNPYQYPVVEAGWRNYLSHMNGVTWPQIPFQATIGGRLDGIVGPVFLLAPLALLSLRWKAGRMLLLLCAVLMLPYFGNLGARFLIMPLPFLSLALALGILAIPRVGSRLAVALIALHVLLSWPTHIQRWFPPYQWQILMPSFRVLSRRIPERQYLSQHFREYEPGLLLERQVPPGVKVFSPAMGQMAYQRRDVLGTFDSAEGRHVWETYRAAFDPNRASTWTRDFTFPALRARRIRLIADSSRDVDFCVNEMRFFRQGSELPRSSSWRLSASSNPWGVQQAFDGNPVSWWTSGTATAPGIWIAADFAQPMELDRVRVEQVVDQRWTHVRLEALIGGLWRDIGATESGTEHPPLPDLRMRVADELSFMGIRWLFIPEGFQGADDLNKYAPYWGATQVAEANGFRLWKLE